MSTPDTFLSIAQAVDWLAQHGIVTTKQLVRT